MTKVEALIEVMKSNKGIASWEFIYENIEKYYPEIKRMNDWQAGIRGILYRELNKKFKKVGLGIFSLIDYKEEKEIISEKDVIRMHTYIEGVCLELGNFDNYDTFTADPNEKFKENIILDNLSTIKSIPEFTYPDILTAVKRIDILWFNKKGFKFPKRAFEVVDSIGTLSEALNRSYQLSEFNLDFYIIGKEIDRNKFETKINREPYIKLKERYHYKNYDEIMDFYKKKLEIETINFFNDSIKYK